MGSDLKGIAILGSTGSIGCQTLEVIRSFPQHFSVVGLGGWRNLTLLQKQVEEFHPALVSCQETERGSAPPGLGNATIATLEEMVSHPQVDLVVMAVAGPAGLTPTLQALRSRKLVALASKEALVMGGQLIAQEMQAGATILPVDSEASAIWQCLRGEDQEVARLIITASGGPFRKRPISELSNVTPEEALNHPTWRMGKKITVDSATLMNKGFEVIEAHWLFQTPWDRIQVALHPQSIVHSLVEFQDGTLKAQMAAPDMRLPIQYALFYPKRMPSQWGNGFDITTVGQLSFEPLNRGRYPCFDLALEAAQAGGTYPAALCAADEVAVGLFLERKLGFTEIPTLVQKVVDKHRPGSAASLEDIMGADAWARRRALELAKG